jgi:predicted secreted protein
MKIAKIILGIVTTFILTTSCSGWSEKDKERYLNDCEKAKLDSIFCNCSLEKITAKYNSFEHAMRNENDFPAIFNACK